ncbi:MAG: preprotein translocase subunit SecG [Clostridia bacterium]|nr:preprotein translocase subunit SecG [Clostridia bacterium]
MAAEDVGMSENVYKYAFTPSCVVVIILMFLAALAAVVLIMFQQSNSEGIQGITATSETFFGKNKGRSVESRLKRWTWICLIVLAVLSLALYILQIALSA